MSTLEIVGAIVMIIVSLAIMGIVTVLESPRDSGLTSLGAGSDSYFSKNQGRTRDAQMNAIVRVCGIAFFVITIVVYAVAR